MKGDTAVIREIVAKMGIPLKYNRIYNDKRGRASGRRIKIAGMALTDEQEMELRKHLKVAFGARYLTAHPGPFTVSYYGGKQYVYRGDMCIFLVD